MRSGRQEYYTCEAKVICRSGKAFKIQLDGEELWIPFSQVQDVEEVPEDDNVGRVVMSAWIAKQKGLI